MSDRTAVTEPGAAGSSPAVCLGDLTVAGVATAHEQLLRAMSAGRELTLDVSAAERVDGAGLQLLIAAALEARRTQGTLDLRGARGGVADVIRRAGAAAILGVGPIPGP